MSTPIDNSCNKRKIEELNETVKRKSNLEHESRSSCESWRMGLESMSQRWEAVLRCNVSDIPHDVTFVIGEEKKKISCHKLILCVASPVFQVMFTERHYESSTNLEIEILDIDPDAFANLIQYVYLDDLDIQVKDALTTMYAANKYDIPELVTYCSDLLQENIAKDNAVTIYQAADTLDDRRLKDSAFEYIINNFQDILDSEEFLKFTYANLCEMLQKDEILIQCELGVFRATLRWATLQCQQQNSDENYVENINNVLGDIKNYIRFPLMQATEFGEHVENTGILTKQQCYDLFRYFSYPESERKKILPVNWNDTVRTCPRLIIARMLTFDESVVLHLKKKYEEFNYYSDAKLHDGFSVASDYGKLELVAVGFVARKIVPNGDIQFALEISNSSHQYGAFGTQYATPMYLETVYYKLTKYAKLIYINLNKPVRIYANQNYRIRLSFKESCAMYCRGVRSAIAIQTQDKKRSLQVNYTMNHGVVSALKFAL